MQREGAMRTVLVTGAAGGIGTRLRKLLKGVYPQIRWSDIRPPPDLSSDETFVQADLADLAQVENAVAGVDGIVHLGGVSMGRRPKRQHRRLLQPVRSSAPAKGQTHRLRLLEPRRGLLSAQTQDRRR